MINLSNKLKKEGTVLASLIEDLTSALNEEDKIYKKLIPIEEEKTQIIIENNLQALSEVTKKEQEFIAMINQLEKKREEIVKNIGVVLNRDSSNLTISAIIEMLEGQDEQVNLASVYDKLSNTLTNMVSINNRNKILIEQSLDMIEFNMNFYQSVQNINNNNYDKGAHSSDGAEESGMFDARQ